MEDKLKLNYLLLLRLQPCLNTQSKPTCNLSTTSSLVISQLLGQISSLFLALTPGFSQVVKDGFY